MRSILILPALAAFLGLAACSHSMNPSSNAEPGTAPAPSFSQFSDIPIPDGARMDADKTLLLGQGENWVGRLVFFVFHANAPDMFDFYKAQMPGYKWQELSSVRADVSVMTWQRADRIATVQIEETTFGCDVTITMGPVNGRTPVGSDQPPPAAGSPVPAVTQQPLK